MFLRLYSKNFSLPFYFSQQKPNQNFYQILQVDPKCKTNDIKSAYYRLAKIYHPDTLPQEFQKSQQLTQMHKFKFNQIKQAYSILIDPQTRRQYDFKLGIRDQTNINDPYNQKYQFVKQKRKRKQQRWRKQQMKEQQELRRMMNLTRGFFVFSIISASLMWLMRPSPRFRMQSGMAPGKNEIL